jgi:hypothetical protein
MKKTLLAGIAALLLAIRGATAEDVAKLFEALLDDGRVLKCGDIKLFKLPDGKVGSNREGVPLKITADSKYIYLDGKPCVVLKCDQSRACTHKSASVTGCPLRSGSNRSAPLPRSVAMCQSRPNAPQKKKHQV